MNGCVTLCVCLFVCVCVSGGKDEEYHNKIVSVCNCEYFLK